RSRIMYANASACQILKMPEGYLIGKEFALIFPTPIQNRIGSILKQVPLPAIEAIPVDDRKLRLTFSRASTLDSIVVLIQDVTEEARQFEEIRQQNVRFQHFQREL